MTKLGKQVLGLGVTITFLILCLFFWRWLQVFNNQVLTVSMQDVPQTETSTIYEAVELKSQKDFVMTGKTIFTGNGFEPEFNFKLSLAGTKFGLDLTSQYGDTKYVGYISLTNQSTTTKTFEGKVLDIDDKMQNVKLQIINKKCGMPSGEEVAYTSIISVSNENLDGCAEFVN